MKLQELTSYLETIAPLRYQESYDNSGLMIGDRDMLVSGITVALDATEEVIQDAIDNQCNVVVSHHPIIFKGIKKFDPHYYVHKAVIKAIKHDVALYAIHTNLDNVLQNGVNQRITSQLDLKDVGLLRLHDRWNDGSDYDVGSGAVGRLKVSMSGDELIIYVKKKMSLNAIRHTRIIDQRIEKVAVCGGSGSFLLPAAKSVGAQAFITADYKYHEFFDANDEILILDVGHYESEYYTIGLLQELLSEKFPNFAPRRTKVTTNPVFYS